MHSHLLVAYDGSPLAARALEIALAEPDASVTVLHVIDPSDPGYSSPRDVDVSMEPLHLSEEWYERADEEADRLHEEVRERAAEADREVTTVTVVGDPGSTIVEYATDNDVDHVLVGSHGRGDASDMLVGRTAELVVARSPVDVTVAR